MTRRRCRPWSAVHREGAKVSFTPSSPPNIGNRRRTQLAQAISQDERVTLQQGIVTAVNATPPNGNLTVTLNGGATAVTLPTYRSLFNQQISVGDTVDVLVNKNGMRIIGVSGYGAIPACRVYSIGQSVNAGPAGTIVQIVLSGVHYSAGGMAFSSGANVAITVPRRGIYAISFQVTYQASNSPVAGAAAYHVSLQVNGSDLSQYEYLPGAVSSFHRQVGSDQIIMSAGDNCGLTMGFPGFAVGTFPSSALTFMTVGWVGPA
jgi:hypothetical protein